MVIISIHVSPALEATNSYTNSITWEITPIHNFRITHLNPGVITPSGQATIIQREIAHYAKGAHIWAHLQDNEGGALSIGTPGSPLIASGLHITISSGGNEVTPRELTYPPGTLPEEGFCFKIDLTPFMQQLTFARYRAPALFDNFPRPTNFGALSNNPINQRFISGPTIRPYLARQLEQQRNSNRQWHLENSRPF